MFFIFGCFLIKLFSKESSVEICMIKEKVPVFAAKGEQYNNIYNRHCICQSMQEFSFVAAEKLLSISHLWV